VMARVLGAWRWDWGMLGAWALALGARALALAHVPASGWGCLGGGGLGCELDGDEGRDAVSFAAPHSARPLVLHCCALPTRRAASVTGCGAFQASASYAQFLTTTLPPLIRPFPPTHRPAGPQGPHAPGGRRGLCGGVPRPRRGGGRGGVLHARGRGRGHRQAGPLPLHVRA
jgi:hypothetical protein